MKTIKINNQKSLDALPDSFTEYTVIHIENTTERIYLKKAHDFSMIAILMTSVVIKKLMDYSVASFRGFSGKIGKKSKTATIIKTPERIERSFNEWLKQGYVHADGITKKLLARKKIDNIEVFEVEEFPSSKSSFVIKKGNVFSHGKTIKEAKDSLKYKIGNRDTSEFKKWNIKTIATQTKMIEAYRVITGACEFGVRDFCQGKKLPVKLNVEKVIELTNGKFGNKQFQEFFK